MIRMSFTGVLFTILASFFSSAHAQSFSIPWFTIDGGGGTSTGGNNFYRLRKPAQ